MGSAKSVNIGGLQFGGGAPVRVESMLKTPLEDAEGCLAELDELKKAGCELVRAAFPREELGGALRKLVERSPLPVMADIHFSFKFALAALDCGCGSIRINPGNMGRRGLMEVLAAARANRAVIRIGSNGGSLGGKQLESCGGDRALALANAVGEQLEPLVEAGFEDIIISAKSSSVPETARANFLLSLKHPFPLHIGITEAGPGIGGAVKSAVGLGILLSQGIGDTMRVSLTGGSCEEVDTAYSILRSLGIRQRGMNLISCPCCGRRRVNVPELVERVKSLLPDNLPDGFTVAVMGCEVNGPKEAASADIGIAGTKSGFVLFKKGSTKATGGLESLDEALKKNLRP
ncbi:MAG: (E)-4-hydroxy-3-methylbut-2-enyl-diphosphate synthase [Synergistaceae bacterium]|nr:(E)-4-hydroxy-3-methylbut-2-enyl-diphosphate synthase [Synergistaceae bacterium]